MGAREDAEDMLQEAFVDIFRKLGTFRSESTFGTWAKRIVINRCINEIKRKKTVFEFFDDMQVFENQKDEDDSRYERKLTVSNVKNAMQFLPSGSRMIFSLYLIEGYDHVEISEILNISVSNSKSQYMRAKNKIKEILKNV
jgi:RNA polymerase sigma-70 factor (ECF subfamily)